MFGSLGLKPRSQCSPTQRNAGDHSCFKQATIMGRAPGFASRRGVWHPLVGCEFGAKTSKTPVDARRFRVRTFCAACKQSAAMTLQKRKTGAHLAVSKGPITLPTPSMSKKCPPYNSFQVIVIKREFLKAVGAPLAGFAQCAPRSASATYTSPE